MAELLDHTVLAGGGADAADLVSAGVSAGDIASLQVSGSEFDLSGFDQAHDAASHAGSFGDLLAGLG